MRLAEFILSNTEPIVMEWEAFARGILPGAKMSSLALREHAQEILSAIARDMASLQSAAQQSDKSKGFGLSGDDGHQLNGASEWHAVNRLSSGFDLLEVVSEYRALRASVLHLWRDSHPMPDQRDVDDLTRFNESIDQLLANAVSSHKKQVDQARDMFLAILGHDLRNPLNSIAMSAALLPTLGILNAASSETTSQISTSAQVMARMISDLLDFTRTRLGAGMPVSPVPLDLGALCQGVLNEFRTAHPNRTIFFEMDGDLSGNWDADRLRQAISNLMANAIQYSAQSAQIDLTLKGDASDVLVIVHNSGPPIPPGELQNIFDPMVRGASSGQSKQNRPGSIGLGLYIAREVAISHGGRIDVRSSEDAGTAFTMRLPRNRP